MNLTAAQTTTLANAAAQLVAGLTMPNACSTTLVGCRATPTCSLRALAGRGLVASVDELGGYELTSAGLALAAADVLAAADDAEQVALDDAASEWVGIRSMAARALAGVEAARAMVSK